MNRKICKVIGALLLAVAIAITQIPATNVDAASDYQLDENILMKYTGTTNVVSVPAGTKEIASEAFADCTTMTTLQLPSGLEKINASAFRGCTNLTSVKIPEGCEVIGAQAFADCTSLVDVSIPASVNTIESGVFSGDKKLANVNIDKANKSYICKDGVIYSADMTKLVEMLQGRTGTSYNMPSTVSDVEKYAFWGCSNLETVTVSNYLEEIPAFAFSFCRGLKEILIPYSVNRINAKAFENCCELVDATIPASVSYIHPTAFDGCAKLNIIAEAGSVAEQFFKEFDASAAALIDYEDNDVEEISLEKDKDESTNNSSDVSDYDPSDVGNVIDVQTPDAENVIGRTKIVFQQAVVFVDNSKVEVLEGDESIIDPDDITDDVSGNSAAEDDSSEDDVLTQKYTIVNGDTIADKAYYGNQDLTEYTFQDGIKAIGDFSFARSAIRSVAIPNGVTQIGYGAFYHCDNLQNIIIPNTVTTIEPAAFLHTPWLENWRNGGDVDSFLVVGDGILIGYKGMNRSVQIPSNVKKIAAEVFKDHKEIAAVYLPDSLTEIGEDAFNGCEQLTQVAGGANLTKISDRAFWGCPLETVRIPEKTEYVGLRAYGGTDATNAVVFQGAKLPSVSYEKTATRLTNESYRELALGCTTAVVNNGIDFEDTILDQDTLGFRGLAVSIISKPTDTTYGAVRLEYCTLEPDENTGTVDIPETVRIYGEEYKITSVLASAFKPYGEYETWVKNNPTAINVNSALTNGMNVTQDLTLADSPGRYQRTVSENSAYIMIDDSEHVIKDGGYVSAEFENRKEDYYLHFTHDKDSEANLKDEIEKNYGTINDEALVTFDMCLYDATNHIPITRLGKEPLTVTMSIPPGMEDDILCVVSLDRNGQLETGFVSYVTKGEQKCIQFRVTHFSPYGIYAADGQLADKINTKLANASGDSDLDVSPDTGDYYDPKWFLAGGCLLLAIFLFLYKK